MTHQSVLLLEAIASLNIKDNGIYIDGTFGRGGHSQAILDKLTTSGRLIAIDKDPEAIDFGKQRFSNDARVSFFPGSFANLAEITQSLGIHQQIDGIILDLGVSSPQIDDATRGFSFMQQGPLDMRMDTTQTLSAAEYVNNADASEMIKVFREYGEERFAGRIANAIVRARLEAPITTTARFAEIVKEANPKWEKHKHPATRVFQAVRIHINQELDDLKKGLSAAVHTLKSGGRLSVISFHSLEDRIVKQFMRNEEMGPQLPISVPIQETHKMKKFIRIGKAIKPQEGEINDNPRSRSAVLRVGEKV